MQQNYSKEKNRIILGANRNRIAVECSQNDYVKEISSLSHQIVSSFSEHLFKRREELNSIKAQKEKEKRNIAIEEEAIQKGILKQKRVLESLRSEKEKLEIQDIKDKNEILNLESDNSKFKIQEKELIHLLEKNEQILSEKNSDLELLKEKFECMKHRQDALNSAQEELNNKYRKFLGIDITKVRADCIRIHFTIQGHYYITVDFRQSPSVIDVEPSIIGLDKCNELFSKSTDFYAFVKAIRENFKHEI